MMPKGAASVLAIALVVMTSGVFGSSPTRSLKTIPSIDDIKTSCRSTASTTLFITSGTASATAQSSCQAFASSINAIEEVAEEYFKLIRKRPKKYCTEHKAKEIIDICAQSIARVYTTASADVHVLGNAVACASASSEGDAYAKSYAALFVQLWLGVTTGENSADAEAQVAALNFALAKAWAAAKVRRCQIGTGRKRGFEDSLAEQIRVALSCVVVELTVKLCEVESKGRGRGGVCGSCATGELKSLLSDTESKSEIGACSKTITVLDNTVGHAKTGGDEHIPVCTGKREKCCGDFYHGKSQCFCGRSCFMKRTDTGIWRHSTNHKVCYCPKHSALPIKKRD